MIDLTILLQAVPEGFLTGNTIQMLMWVAIIAIMYFFILRPGTKKAKKEASFNESLKSGDKVVTKSGIHGKISKVSERTVILQVADNVKLKVERNALSADMSSAGETDG